LADLLALLTGQYLSISLQIPGTRPLMLRRKGFFTFIDPPPELFTEYSMLLWMDSTGSLAGPPASRAGLNPKTVSAPFFIRHPNGVLKVKTSSAAVPQGLARPIVETGFAPASKTRLPGPPPAPMAHDSATRRKLMQNVE